MTEPFYDAELAAVHEADFTDLAHSAAQVLLRRLAAVGQHTGTIVDLGCGGGALASVLTAAGYDVVGVDLSDAMIELARANVPDARFVRGSIWDIPLPPAVAVTAVGEVVNYAADPRAGPAQLEGLFARAHDALAPGGVLLFDVATPGRGGPAGATTGLHDRDTYALHFEAHETTADDDGTATMERRMVLFTRDGDVYRRSDELHHLRLYPVAQVTAMLERVASTSRCWRPTVTVRCPRDGSPSQPPVVGDAAATVPSTPRDMRATIRTCPMDGGRPPQAYVRCSSMRSTRWRRSTTSVTRARIVVSALALIALLAAPSAAGAEPLDLDRAEENRDRAAERQEQLQADLNRLLSRIEQLKVAREQQTAEIGRLGVRLRTERRTARQARSQVAERYRQAYKTGGGDPLLLMFNGDSLDDVTERARLLTLLARDSRTEQEAAEGASLTTAALSARLRAATDSLASRTRELAATKREAQEKVAQAQAAVDDLDQRIATERQRRAAQRDAQDDPGGGGSGGGGSAPVSGGIACPVAQPRNYTDTYGAPRSGGRSHLGVDILAPIGTASYAYENGTITRMDGNALGGISLYLRGASGNVYYYTHLSGYRAGVSVGQQVSAGQHIAYVGDTGNAAGIPHLHWEVQPGGSGNVNPYPYAYRACG